jgi:hypothetical protein
MNCHQFAARLQQTLDDRRRPEADLQLRDHTTHCSDCRRQLQAWQQISGVISRQPESGRRRSPVACGLAAAILLAVVLRLSVGGLDGDSSLSSASLSVSPPSAAEPVVDTTASLIVADTDATNWWRQVHGRDWFGETMPVVRSVREGVAPLGRSLLQAVTILTIGGGDRPT